MVPVDPPESPTIKGGSSGVPESVTTGAVTAPQTGPVYPRARTGTFFSSDGPVRGFLKRWGFPLFVLLMIFIGRSVILPFVFAFLIAYILAPVVRWMAERKNGTRRMPRGLAIIICYLVFLAAVAGFMFLLVPRLSRDFARLAQEGPALYKKVDTEWTPQLARWLEQRFPSLQPPRAVPDEPATVPGVPLPPGTALTLTQLPDNSYAVQLSPNGIDIKPTREGAWHIQPNEKAPDPLTVEDKIRAVMGKGVAGLQSKLNEAVKLGQAVVFGFARGIFLFFFTLMIGAFILIDLEKVHAFLRSLFPQNVRDDYDTIIAGIDRGLSGVIRGQLVICLINGILTYIGLLIFGVKYSLILGVVAAALTLVPIFGSILSSIPIVAVALVSGESGVDVVRGLAIGLWILGIHFVEANLLNPKIIGTAAKIHPVLVIFALFLGEHKYGLVGALLAVPVLSAIQVVFVFLYRKTWRDVPKRPGEQTAPMLASTTGPIKAP